LLPENSVAVPITHQDLWLGDGVARPHRGRVARRRVLCGSLELRVWQSSPRLYVGRDGAEEAERLVSGVAELMHLAARNVDNIQRGDVELLVAQ